MSYLIVFVYVLGVLLSPYFIDWMNKAVETETDPENEVWVEIFFPWFWPMMLVAFVVLLILWSPSLLRDFIKGKSNG